MAETGGLTRDEAVRLMAEHATREWADGKLGDEPGRADFPELSEADWVAVWKMVGEIGPRPDHGEVKAAHALLAALAATENTEPLF